jgi:hypothetical protein
MIPCTVSIYGAVQNGLTAEDAFCMRNAHSEWGSEGALARAKVRYMPQVMQPSAAARSRSCTTGMILPRTLRGGRSYPMDHHEVPSRKTRIGR